MTDVPRLKVKILPKTFSQDVFSQYFGASSPQERARYAIVSADDKYVAFFAFWYDAVMAARLLTEYNQKRVPRRRTIWKRNSDGTPVIIDIVFKTKSEAVAVRYRRLGDRRQRQVGLPYFTKAYTYSREAKTKEILS